MPWLATALLWLALVVAGVVAQTSLDQALVIGVVFNDNDPTSARAYPIEILDWHEIVNDVYNNHSFSITWAPLTATNVVFYTQTLYSRNKQLGTSGKLFQNNMLAYDRATRSLWSQMLRASVQGVLIGDTMDIMYSVLTRWTTWRKLYPNTTVLARPSNSRRNYFIDPYKRYKSEDRIMLPSCFSDHYTQIPWALKRSKDSVVIAFTPSGRPQIFPKTNLILYPVINTVDYESKERILVVYDASGDTDEDLVMTFSPLVNESVLIFDTVRHVDHPNSMGEAITGRLAGIRLNKVKSFHSYWFAAISIFPNALIWHDNELRPYTPEAQCPPALRNDTACHLIVCSEIVAAGPEMDAIKPIDAPLWNSPDEFESEVRTPWTIVMPYAIIATCIALIFIIVLIVKSRPQGVRNGNKEKPKIVTKDDDDE